MNEELAKQLSNILEEKNIDLNQILENFTSNSSDSNNSNNNSSENINTETTSSNSNYSSSSNDTNSNDNFNKKHGNFNKNENNFDPEMLFKIQKIMALLNSQKNTKDENLLKALKPYMHNSRKDKIDKYIQLLHMIKIFEKFQEMGGNLNDFL